MRAIVAILACFALAACAGSPRPSRAQMERIDRALVGAPGAAQPGKIVATELAFARAAKDDGQWTAFDEYAAPGALIHGPDGTVAATAWTKGRKDPTVAVKWSPRYVWMSCDATLAISLGKLQAPDGQVGTFTNIWQLQADRTYRYVYAIAELDDPQPVRNPDEPEGENEILVVALDAIQGKVADCLKPGEKLPPKSIHLTPPGSRFGEVKSRDGTLEYQWEHAASGRRALRVEYVREGEWREVLYFPKRSREWD